MQVLNQSRAPRADNLARTPARLVLPAFVRFACIGSLEALHPTSDWTQPRARAIKVIMLVIWMSLNVGVRIEAAPTFFTGITHAVTTPPGLDAPQLTPPCLPGHATQNRAAPRLALPGLACLTITDRAMPNPS